MNNTVLGILLQNLNLDENVLASLHTVINESLEEKEVDNFYFTESMNCLNYHQ